VRAIALLLVAAGLHAGSFRDLDNVQDWYFGTPDYSAAVLSEARKSLATRAQADGTLDHERTQASDDAPALGPHFAQPVATQTAFARGARHASPDTSVPLRLRPDPTGPPRA